VAALNARGSPVRDSARERVPLAGRSPTEVVTETPDAPALAPQAYPPEPLRQAARYPVRRLRVRFSKQTVRFRLVETRASGTVAQVPPFQDARFLRARPSL